jgi:hypothetical protein
MPLVREELNPLSVLGIRKLSFIPQHFKKIKLGYWDADLTLLDNWINFNLSSRYAIIRTLKVNQDNKIIDVIEIGLEDPKEVTMLTLGCSYLYNNN